MGQRRHRSTKGRAAALAAATILVTVTLAGGLAGSAGAQVDVPPEGYDPAYGTPAGSGLPHPRATVVATSRDGTGAWVATAEGDVTAFGTAEFFGGLPAATTTYPVTAMASTPTGAGYRLATADGRVFHFGDAVWRGDAYGWGLVSPVAAMASSPSGLGYWLFTTDGGVFAFGDAPFAGSLGAEPPPSAVVDAHPTPSGQGYWMVAADGGVFAFGDAPFLGSLGGAELAAPMVAMRPSPTGWGYLLLDSAGTTYAFGDAVALPPAAPGEAGWVGEGQVAVGVSALTGVVVSAIPATLFTNRSTWPEPPPESGAGRRAVYANGDQRVWLVGESGVVENSYLVSGRRNTPGPGTYAVYSKSILAWAGHDGITMTHMVRFARGTRGGSIGFHAIPVGGGGPLQTEAQLGTFRSAGCVRQAVSDAVAMWAWAEVGTTVTVTP